MPTHTALSGAFGSGPRSGAHHCQPSRAGLEPALQWRRDFRRHRGATTGRRVHCAASPHRPRRLRPSGKRGARAPRAGTSGLIRHRRHLAESPEMPTLTGQQELPQLEPPAARRQHRAHPPRPGTPRSADRPRGSAAPVHGVQPLPPAPASTRSSPAISWQISPSRLPRSSTTFPANPARFRSYQALKPSRGAGPAARASMFGRSVRTGGAATGGQAHRPVPAGGGAAALDRPAPWLENLLHLQGGHLDRVSRDGGEATLSILRRFAGHGTAVWALKEPWTQTAVPRMRSCSRRFTRGWLPRSPGVVRSGPGSAWNDASARACRSVGSRARRTRSRGSTAGTWPAGSVNGRQRDRGLGVSRIRMFSSRASLLSVPCARKSPSARKTTGH